MENVEYFDRRIILLLFLVCMVVGCGPAAKFDYDPATDFSQYKTYKWFPTLETGVNEFDNRRMMRSVDSILQSRGFVESETADFMINFYTVEEIVPPNTVGIGIGSGGGGIAEIEDHGIRQYVRPAARDYCRSQPVATRGCSTCSDLFNLR